MLHTKYFKSLFFLFILSFHLLLAQDGFNTTLISRSTAQEGNFVDLVIEDEFLYSITTDNFFDYYLALFELSVSNTLNYVDKVQLEYTGAVPIKIEKYGNHFSILFRSSSFPTNSPGGIQIFSIGTNQEITLLSQYDIDGFKYDFQMTDKNIFVAAGESGLHILDYQNPSEPFLVSKYDPGNYSTGNGVIDVSIFENILSVSMFTEGLDLVDISNIENPQKITSYNNDNSFVRMSIIKENYLYVVYQSNGIEILDIAIKEEPILVSHFNAVEYPREVSSYGNYLFVTEWRTQIIDILNKSNPVHVGYAETGGLGMEHFIANNNIYVIGNEHFWTPYSQLFHFTYDIVDSKITITSDYEFLDWLSGSDKVIDLETYNSTSVNLELSTDNGEKWFTVIENNNVNGYNDRIRFEVPKVHSSECFIKVSDTDNEEIFDIYPEKFKIQRLHLSKPNPNYFPPQFGTYNRLMEIEWYTYDLDTVSIYYSLNDGDEWHPIIESKIDTSEYQTRNYTWRFDNLFSDSCRIKVVNSNDQSQFEMSQRVKISSTVDVEDDEIINEFKIFDAYPNPFNSQTIIEYTLPQQESLKIYLYDSLGKYITTIFEGERSAGRYSEIIDASELSSGVYFISFQSQKNAKVKKIILIK